MDGLLSLGPFFKVRSNDILEGFCCCLVEEMYV